MSTQGIPTSVHRAVSSPSVARTDKEPSAGTFLPTSRSTAPSKDTSVASMLAPSPTTTRLEPSDDDSTTIEAAPLKTVKRFDELPGDMVRALQVLTGVDGHASLKHRQFKKMKSAPGIARAEERLKKAKKQGRLDSAAYSTLQQDRSKSSAMEESLSEKSVFRSMLYAPTGGIRNTKSGLYAELRSFGDGYLLCFVRSGAAGNLDVQWKANIKQALGLGVPRAYHEAVALAQELRTALPKDKPLAIAGHSMGGGIANFVGLALNMDSYCFNAAALGEKSLDYLSMNGCLTKENISKQKHARLKADFASGSGWMKAARHLGRKKIRPTLVGTVYEGNRGAHPLAGIDMEITAHGLRSRRTNSNTPGSVTVTTTSAGVSTVHSTAITPAVELAANADSQSDEYFSFEDNSDQEYTSARDKE